MILTEEINQIIKRRKEKIPYIQKWYNKVAEITKDLNGVSDLRKDMLENATEFRISSEVKNKIEALDISGYMIKFDALKNKCDEILSRFDRDEINIAVVGSARQGKSRFLQSISSLDNLVIPAFESDDCTGATSIIKNVEGDKLSAEVQFMTESEMLKCVQRYIDKISGGSAKQLGSFRDIGNINLSELESYISGGSPLRTPFEHLSKYVQHFSEWSELVKKGSVILTEPEEIQQYVAQHNGKNEDDTNRKDYYFYLAVKEVVISCEFRNVDAGKVVLRDTIGLGDTSLGIEEKMLEAIGHHSDAAIIVRRPEVGTGKFDGTDDQIYEKLYDHFKDRHMDKWLFWLINKTKDGSVYGNNENRCKAFESKIKDKKWKLADNFIVDVSDEETVNQIFCDNVLKTLISNIDDIDDGILHEIRTRIDDVYDMYSEIQNAVEGILVAQGGTEIDKNEFLDRRWKEFYERTLMKSLKKYKNELSEKKDEDCLEFRNSIERILTDSKELIPSLEMLKEDLEAGGQNRPFEVYSHHMDKIRTDFTEKFLKVDELIFDEKLRAFKERVVDIFAAEDGGRLKYVVPLDDRGDKVAWLYRVSNELFVKNRFSQFRTAFLMLADFQLSVRGFLMHRIRSRIDRLENIGYDTKEKATVDIATEIQRMITRKMKDVREEIEDEMKEDFYKDPNRIFYAVLAEFYDRINFSYTNGSLQDVEVAWKSLYFEHCNKVWMEEFRKNQDMSELYKRWSGMVTQLQQYEKRDFELANIEWKRGSNK